MARFLKAQPRVYVIIALVLAVAAWGRLAAMAVINPPPMHVVRLARPDSFPSMGLSCDRVVIADGPTLYRFSCLLASQGYIGKLDTAQGLIDGWPLAVPVFYGSENDLAGFKKAADGTVTISFAANTKDNARAGTYALQPNMQTALAAPSDGDPAPPAPLNGPTTEPASLARIAPEIANQRWLTFNIFQYAVDTGGKIHAAEVRTGHIGEDYEMNLPLGLREYNLLPLGSRWALVELRTGPTHDSWGTLSVIDDQTGAVMGVVAAQPPVIAYNFVLAAPDAEGGLWLLGQAGSTAHFDSSLHRTDTPTVFERLWQIEVVNFSLWNLQPDWWISDSHSVYNLDLIPLKQLAIPCVLLGGPILALAAWLAWRRRTAALPEPLLAGPELRAAAQVYIVLFVLFVFWYWQMTAVF